MRIAYSDGMDTAKRALRVAGVPEPGARLQASLLVEAELRGRASHGLLRLPRIIERIRNGVADPVADGEHRWHKQAFLQVDGQNGLGPVVAGKAIDLLVGRAATTGIAIAAIARNNHLGMLGWYAERVASDGMVIIGMTTSEALVHPWGGRSALLGTNPIAIGVPTGGRPLVLDMATSLVSMGQIHDFAQTGRALQPGWALDAAGNPTTDAAAARSGSITPFGGAKGYALGLAFEVLVVSLTASAIGTEVVGTLDATEVCNKGDIFIVIDPGRRPGIAERISGYLDLVRASGSEGAKVAIPGDRAEAERIARLEAGFELPDELWALISNLAGPAPDQSLG